MINPPWYEDPVEKLAFNAYAMHTSELDELVVYFRNRPELELNDRNIYDACLYLRLSFFALSHSEYDYVMKGLHR